MRKSPASESIARSGIRAMAALAQDRKGLVHLEFGEPGFFAPEAVRNAASQAVREQRMVYTPTEGPRDLREEIAKKLFRVNGLKVQPDQVFITAGGTGALFGALGTVLGPGDKILVPDPGWPNTAAQVRVLGAEPVLYPLEPDRGFLPVPEEWPIDEHTRAVLVNNPSNPTGVVFDRPMLQRIVDVARGRGLWIIADEVYDQVYFGQRPTSVFELYPEGTIAIFSFSKTYAMTGWRLGYAVLPEGLREWTTKIVEACFASSSMVAQLAAIAALTEVADEEIQAMVDSYHVARDRAIAMLDGAGKRRYVPEGAFYLLMPVPRGVTSDAFARRLLSEKDLVVAPGSTFGRIADGEVRLSLAASEGAVAEGVARILEYSEQIERDRTLIERA